MCSRVGTGITYRFDMDKRVPWHCLINSTGAHSLNPHLLKQASEPDVDEQIALVEAIGMALSGAVLRRL